MRIAAILFPFAFALVGCATSDRQSSRTPTTSTWTMGDFGVYFQAGPRVEEGKSSSYYKITYSPAAQQERELVMESAHSLGGFSVVTNGDPKNWIRIISDSSGRALLIEEEIPNDCGPCSNYLWVHLDPNDFIEGEYLQLPSKVTGPPGGIDYEYPKVLSLDGDLLSYSYSIGDAITKRIGQIEKTGRPTPPG